MGIKVIRLRATPALARAQRVTAAAIVRPRVTAGLPRVVAARVVVGRAAAVAAVTRAVAADTAAAVTARSDEFFANYNNFFPQARGRTSQTPGPLFVRVLQRIGNLITGGHTIGGAARYNAIHTSPSANKQKNTPMIRK